VSARRWPAPPAGFAIRPEGVCAVYVAPSLEDAVRARGLLAWELWDRALSGGEAGSGRGVSVVVDGEPGHRWRLKRMRRGGRLAGLWRDRYPSAARLVAILAASSSARARGVPTPRAVALIVSAGPAGLIQGSMAFEEIEGAVDLARLVQSGRVTREELEAALRAVRAMHDAGVTHPDLNLGNILLRPRPDAPPEAFIVDLDGATFAEDPLPFTPRQAAVRRLERSCAKLTGAPGPLGAGSEDLWYSIYAGGDDELAGRFALGRRVGRWTLAAHRLGWKRNRT